MAPSLHIPWDMDLVLTRPNSRTTDAGPRIAVASSCALLLGTVGFLLQAGRAHPRTFLIALPMALLVAGFLWAQERAGYLLEIAVAGAFLLLGLLPWLGLPQDIWFGVVALPFAAGAAHKLADHPGSSDAVVPARQMMLQGIMLFAAAVSVGLMLPAL